MQSPKEKRDAGSFMKVGPEHSRIPLGPHHIVKKFQSVDPNVKQVAINGLDVLSVSVSLMVWFLSLFFRA